MQLKKFSTEITDLEIIEKNKRLMEEERSCFLNPFDYDISYIQQFETKGFNDDEEINVEVELNILSKDDVKEVEEIKQTKDDILFPLPTHKNVLENKKIPYNLFATLMINSKFDKNSKDEYRNYLYKNKMEDIMDFLNELEQREGTKLTNKRTVERHIKTLLDCGIDLMKVSNTENGIVYHIKSSVEGKYYVKLPYKQIRELIVSTNKNMLKLFAFLKVMCNENDFTTIDRRFLCEHIGLSADSRNNMLAISTMTNSLAKLGFIEILQTTKIESDDKGKQTVKTINSYRVRTYEEYLDIDKNAKRRN
ncbi:MAG: hypothetical protein IJ086_14100 [Clostridium sp.]|nr:hypothetical protein [Clostridium sp.]